MSQGSSLRRLLAATGLISKQQTSLLIRTLGGQTCPLAALSNDAVTDASRGRSLHTPASPASSSSQNSGGTPELNWVFLGPPGVGKGTYASRIAKRLNIAHIATGDLIRDEIKAGSTVGQQMQSIVNSGKLVPDDMIFDLLHKRLDVGRSEKGEQGFILDGFPRTQHQAQTLLATYPIHLALNLGLREEVLITKCLGRRMCRHCGKNYNIATIDLPATGGRPRIWMPPLPPPPECAPHLEQREDDTQEVVRRRLQVYQQQAAPVEQVFADAGLLLDFEITAGIPETLPHLLAALQPYIPLELGGTRGLEHHQAVNVATPQQQKPEPKVAWA